MDQRRESLRRNIRDVGGIRRDYPIGQEFQEAKGGPLNQVPWRHAKEDEQKTDSRFCGFDGGIRAEDEEVIVMVEIQIF